MVFFVIEFQTNECIGAVIPTAFTDRDQAEAAYHTTLASAAVSSVDKHGVMLCTEDMVVIKQEIYIHIEPVEPVEE